MSNYCPGDGDVIKFKLISTSDRLPTCELPDDDDSDDDDESDDADDDEDSDDDNDDDHSVDD